ncbi:membrane protein insertase YidC [Sulfurimonas aquatica]|uniref:Membrane protein insertase YidC n=1 Tax=Sulfurimonas aquatica TaxID=2672570 RepID=A0A975GDD4_9BACT|nr:membrane protein insertase YidC [Sulfurimonas aquatica]QSZ42472.1 membrane protein insertase YidC [Sulfurimonas aquatica]
MLDKLSPNQRLLVAVLLSVIFFVAYTAIFPPIEMEAAQGAKTKTVELKGTNEESNTVVDSPAGHSISKQDKIAASATNNILTVTNKNYILKMDTLGRISSKELRQEKFRDKEDNHAQLIPAFGTKPLYIRFLDENLNAEATSVAYTASAAELNIDGSPKSVTLTQKLSTLEVVKKLTFYDDGHYDVEISLSQDKRYFVYLGQRPQVNETEQMMTVVGAMVYTDDELVTIIEDGDAEGRKSFTGVELISAFDQYTASIMYGFAKERNIIVERDRDDNPITYFDGLQNIKFSGYIGQKNYKTLEAINPVLTNAIEYGWFTFASKPLFALLSWLHGIFGNWGWAIIALTAIIRAILYPLTYKGMVSMQKIKELAPKMKDLKEKYKSDPARLNQATMDMYKKHGANPLGGCLPMLMQIPVFFAIYRVLLNAVELQGSPWILWINDLSRMDGYYVLPVLMGASMFFQQKLTPTNFTDPMQEKVMKFLPVIFTVFFITFPSGLVLYWFVNNLFSIAQQSIVNQQFKNAKDAKAVVEKKSEK